MAFRGGVPLMLGASLTSQGLGCPQAPMNVGGSVMKELSMKLLLVLTPFIAMAAACGNDANDGEPAADPRCDSLCTIKEPELEDAYDVCSQASAQRCLRDCAARLVDVSSVCASCLVEEACFDVQCGPHKGPGGVDCDSSGVCTIYGREGSCSYPAGNQAALEDCLRQVYPRREVECTPEYRPVAGCAAVCS